MCQRCAAPPPAGAECPCEWLPADASTHTETHTIPHTLHDTTQEDTVPNTSYAPPDQLPDAFSYAVSHAPPDQIPYAICNTQEHTTVDDTVTN